MADNYTFYGLTKITVAADGCTDCGLPLGRDKQLVRESWVLIERCGEALIVRIYRCGKCAHARTE